MREAFAGMFEHCQKLRSVLSSNETAIILGTRVPWCAFGMESEDGGSTR